MVKHITLERNRYESDKEFWSDVTHTLRVLVENGYVTEFNYEDCGFYTIWFDHANDEIAEYHLKWLDDDELDYLMGFVREDN